jgi:hypothetical protein
MLPDTATVARITRGWSAADNAELIRLFRKHDRDLRMVAGEIGRTHSSVACQVSRLGLSRNASGVKMRECMSCDREFRSEGIFERICLGCKQTGLFRYA